MVERICVWCLVIVVIFMGFGQAGTKRCGRCSKVISWGWECKSQKESLFIGKAGSHYVIMLYCETLLQFWLGIYCKKFYWILLFTILLLLYVFEVGKAKSATQSVPNDINTEWAIPERFLSFLLYPWRFHILNPSPFPPVCFFPL